MKISIASLRFAGVTDTQILDAIAQSEVEAEAARREADRTRQARYRYAKRQAIDNAQSMSRVTDVTSVTEDAPPKVPPITPLNTPSSKPNGFERNGSPTDPSIEERDLFEKGKAVLGPNAGGMIANLKRSKGGNVALARAVIEQASVAQNPREYVAGAIRGKPNGLREDRSTVAVGRRLIEEYRAAEEAAAMGTLLALPRR